MPGTSDIADDTISIVMIHELQLGDFASTSLFYC